MSTRTRGRVRRLARAGALGALVLLAGAPSPVRSEEPSRRLAAELEAPTLDAPTLLERVDTVPPPPRLAPLRLPRPLAATAPPTEPAPAPPRHVALFGASSMSHPHAPLVRELRALFDGAEVSSHGRRGWNVRGWLRADPEEEVRGADLVIVYLGPNAETHRASEVAELDRRLRSGGARVVWLRPPGFADEQLAQRSRSMWDAIVAADVERVDAELSPGEDGTSDGLHVSAEGARRWVAAAAPALLAR